MRYEDYKESLLAPQEIIEIFKGFEAENYKNSIPRDVFFNAVKNSDGAVLYSYSNLEAIKDQYDLSKDELGRSSFSKSVLDEYHEFMSEWVEYAIGHEGTTYRIYGKNIRQELLFYLGLEDEIEAVRAEAHLFYMSYEENVKFKNNVILPYMYSMEWIELYNYVGGKVTIWMKIRNLYRRFVDWVSNLTRKQGKRFPKSRDESIFALLSSSVDQIPTDTNPVVITYNTQDAINGLTHSTTVNSGEITINKTGGYIIYPQSQVGKDTTTGSEKTELNMFLQVDRGFGFVDESKPKIKLIMMDSNVLEVIDFKAKLQLNVGDKIRIVQKVSDSSVGMGLKYCDEVGFALKVPSVIFYMYLDKADKIMFHRMVDRLRCLSIRG